MLLTLIPLALILLAVGKRVNAIALTLTFHILTLKAITIDIVGLALAMRLITKHFALIDAIVSSVTRPQHNFL
jgi:hypothetical protein